MKLSNLTSHLNLRKNKIILAGAEKFSSLIMNLQIFFLMLSALPGSVKVGLLEE